MRALPTTLRIAVLLLFAEAAGVAAVAALFAVGRAVAVAVLLAMFAVVLAALGWQLVRLRSWARGPAITLELLLLPVAYPMVTGGIAWLGDTRDGGRFGLYGLVGGTRIAAGARYPLVVPAS